MKWGSIGEQMNLQENNINKEDLLSIQNLMKSEFSDDLGEVSFIIHRENEDKGIDISDIIREE